MLAEEAELKSLEEVGTWELVRKSEGNTPLPTKWVYKTKLKADGTIEHYKAQLVARGNRQVFGEDYLIIFSTVMKINNLKVILVMSQICNVPARHGDVPSAYKRAKKEDEYEILY